MFAALTVVRLREAITAAGLGRTKSWVSPDDVQAVDLPLAKAAEKVLGSMQSVLQKTKTSRDEALKGKAGPPGLIDNEGGSEKRMHLRRTKAAEVMLVRNLEDLRRPWDEYRARALGYAGGDAVRSGGGGHEASAGMNAQFRG